MGMEDHVLGTPQSAAGPAQPALLREMNEQSIYNMIRELRPISRAELSRRSGLSKPTVSLALRTLVDTGLVTAVGMESGKPGRAGLLFDPVADVCLAAAVTVGSDTVSCRILDLDGNELAEASRQLPDDGAARADAEHVRLVIDEAIARCELPADRLVSVGVALPAVVDPATGSAHWRDGDGQLHSVAITEDLERSSGLSVEVTNRVHAAAVGELHAGSGQGRRHLMMASRGKHTRIATILDGQLVRGAHGGAGLLLGSRCDVDPENSDIALLVTAGRLVEPELLVINERVEPAGAAKPVSDDDVATLSRHLGEVEVVRSELGADAVRAGIDHLAVQAALRLAFSSRMQRIAAG